VGVFWVVRHFSKSQNLKIDVAKNATLVALKSTFIKFLGHILCQFNKKVLGPKNLASKQEYIDI